MDWVIKDQLARSPRPGFPSHDVPPEDVDQWIQEVISLGIKSIIVLLHDTQLTWYPRLEEGLLSRYEQAGLDVYHFSILVIFCICNTQIACFSFQNLIFTC